MSTIPDKGDSHSDGSRCEKGHGVSRHAMDSGSVNADDVCMKKPQSGSHCGTRGQLSTNKPYLRALGWFCRIVLAAVFIYAGWVKLLAPADFVQDILNYRLVGAPVAFWLAVVLPPLEIALGLYLLVTRLARAAALCVAALCVVFLLAILSAWGRGLDISCGCFGIATVVVSYPMLVLRSCLLIAAAFTVFITLRRNGCR